MAAKKKKKSMDTAKLAICVGIGVALGLVFHDDSVLGLPPASIGAVLGVIVASWWTKAEQRQTRGAVGGS